MRFSPRRVAAAVAGVTALTAVVCASPSTASTGKRFTPVRINGEQIRSISLSDINQFASLSIGDLQRIKADGFNMVSIYVYRFMDTPQSDGQHTGANTEPDALIEQTIDAAHAAGLAVNLTPTIWVGPGVGAFYWRGLIYPTDRNAFFDSYRAMLTHYADLAQAHHVELFGLGSEMSSLESQVDQWRHTISDVRAHYTGPLTYFTVTANVASIKWWGYLDLPGISPYVSLSTDANPSYDQVVDAWKRVVLPQLRKVQKAVGRPLFVAETGYPSTEYAAEHPELGAAGPANEELQATLYRALLDTLMSTPGFDGLNLWRWSTKELGPLDRGFSPKGKAAECVIAERWSAAGTSASQCTALGRVAL